MAAINLALAAAARQPMFMLMRHLATLLTHWGVRSDCTSGPKILASHVPCKQSLDIRFAYVATLSKWSLFKIDHGLQNLVLPAYAETGEADVMGSALSTKFIPAAFSRTYWLLPCPTIDACMPAVCRMHTLWWTACPTHTICRHIVMRSQTLVFVSTFRQISCSIHVCVDPPGWKHQKEGISI